MAKVTRYKLQEGCNAARGVDEAGNISILASGCYVYSEHDYSALAKQARALAGALKACLLEMNCLNSQLVKGHGWTEGDTVKKARQKAEAVVRNFEERWPHVLRAPGVQPGFGPHGALIDFVTAALEAERPKWTSEKPKVAGLYLNRVDGQTCAVVVSEINGTMLANASPGFNINGSSRTFAVPVVYITGEWAGPIPQPEEAG